MTDTLDRPNVDASHYAENAGKPVAANPVEHAAAVAEAEANLEALMAQPVAPVIETVEPGVPGAQHVGADHIAHDSEFAEEAVAVLEESGAANAEAVVSQAAPPSLVPTPEAGATPKDSVPPIGPPQADAPVIA